MKQLSSIVLTGDHYTGLIYRITLGVVILPHGCQMMLGWFGGYGFSGSMQYLTQTEGLPWIVGFGVIALQFFGALSILAGFGARLLAVATMAMFTGMILTSHIEHGFFMNWGGNQQGEGFEYHLLVIGLSIALMLNGAGKYSVDLLLTRNRLKPAVARPFRPVAS